jgi:drug/metabolite transporter (DMT)-like permease
MTIIPALIIATLVYGLYTYVSFSPELKGSNLIVYLGLLCAVLANVVWVFLAKDTTDNNKLIRYALYWDSLIIIITLLVPVILFGIRFSVLQLVGLIATILGLALIKIGSS